MWKVWVGIPVIALLAACAGAPAPRPSATTPVSLNPGALPPPAQCALFAREFTGINIRANAYQWWDLAAGQYPRGDTPRADTILVLKSTAQLPLGHVGIVKRVVGPREITLTHANWGSDDPTRRIIHDHTAVIDVSQKNDWSEVRFWNAPSHAFGKVYAAYGFIYPRAYTANAQPVW